MIGVVAPAAVHRVVVEFFELFKTPWEIARSDRQYDVLLCSASEVPPIQARLRLLYGPAWAGKRTQTLPVSTDKANVSLVRTSNGLLPVYLGLFGTKENPWQGIVDDETGCAAAYEMEPGTLGIGYDLFAEVGQLLKNGQPIAYAQQPTLELHIALLRDLITSGGVAIIEVPPNPFGHDFAVCLTHDVDHPVMRNHLWDSTMFGFLFRATIGSLRRVMQGRLTFLDMLKNWGAALRLPLMHLGLVRDVWRKSLCDYAVVEQGLGSTFFFIPFRDRPGKRNSGSAPGLRAAKYGVDDVEEEMSSLAGIGCEIGLHGIDAWCDEAKAAEEKERIIRVTGEREIGVRMHWLYFDEHSHRTLENAGFAYDSTVGYNETVGFRAGTLQVFQPLDVSRLMELPLHIMDTALFYPGRSNLGPGPARDQVDRIVGHASRLGGVVTINWHDRSLAPERMWGGFYQELLDCLKSRGACFATAGTLVTWFRDRRAVRLEELPAVPGQLRVNVKLGNNSGGKQMRLRLHTPATDRSGNGSHASSQIDYPLREGEMVFAI